mgnify:CR=1 FL=1
MRCKTLQLAIKGRAVNAEDARRFLAVAVGGSIVIVGGICVGIGSVGDGGSERQCDPQIVLIQEGRVRFVSMSPEGGTGETI